jgi:phosphatidylinositol alpha-mannosyltransferase
MMFRAGPTATAKALALLALRSRATDRAHTRANICQSQDISQTDGRRRTIAVVAPHYPPHVGGAEAYADRLVKRYQADDNLRPIVVTTKPRGLRTTLRSQDGVQIVELSTWWSLSNTPLNPMWPLTLSRIFSKFDVDVVHAHAPVPVLADIAVRIAGSRPTLLTYHCGSMIKNSWPADLVIRLYERYLLPRTFERVDKVLAVSPSALGADRPNAEVLTPGVDTELFHPPAQRRDVSRTILYVGRIDRSSAWKGIEELIRAFAITHANAPDARLRIVGDGDATPELRALCHALDIADYVEFSGRLSGTDLADAYRVSRCLVLPSLTAAESFGMTLIEAMASGRPVIGSRVGGIPFVIEDGYNGLLVPPGDIEALARACDRMLADDAMAERMGRNGRLLALSRYRWDITTGRYLQLVQSLPRRRV